MYTNSINYNNDFLSHHGIKGQRWGIRRYKNDDGSLTGEGKKRYGIDENGKQSKEGKKLQKAETKNQKAIDHPAKQAAKSGIKAMLALSAIGVLGVASGAFIGLHGGTNSVGRLKTGKALIGIGQTAAGISGLMALGVGLSSFNKNVDMKY